VQPHELENLRRSLAMLNPGAAASLLREEAMRLITEVADLQARLERLRLGLRQLVDEAGKDDSSQTAELSRWSVLDPQDLVEPRQLEGPPRERLRRADRQTPGVAVEVLVHPDQRVDALGVEEAHPRKVDYHLSRRLCERLDQRSLDLVGVGYVDLAPNSDDNVAAIVVSEPNKQLLNCWLVKHGPLLSASWERGDRAHTAAACLSKRPSCRLRRHSPRFVI
jgi:hypothetical protein